MEGRKIGCIPLLANGPAICLSSLHARTHSLFLSTPHGLGSQNGHSGDHDSSQTYLLHSLLSYGCLLSLPGKFRSLLEIRSQRTNHGLRFGNEVGIDVQFLQGLYKEFHGMIKVRLVQSPIKQVLVTDQNQFFHIKIVGNGRKGNA